MVLKVRRKTCSLTLHALLCQNNARRNTDDDDDDNDDEKRRAHRVTTEPAVDCCWRCFAVDLNPSTPSPTLSDHSSPRFPSIKFSDPSLPGNVPSITAGIGRRETERRKRDVHLLVANPAGGKQALSPAPFMTAGAAQAFALWFVPGVV